MAQYPVFAAQRSLIDAVSRDALITALFAAACLGLDHWHTTSGSMVSLIAGQMATFLMGFIFIYLAHEWGHYIGARLSGANIPLGPANGVLLGLFGNAAHSPRQFMGMAMGGEFRYLVPATILIAMFWNAGPLAGLAVGSAAFIVQALYVDVPILWKIHRGADIQSTLDAGLAPKTILRKTLISWVLLGAGIASFAAAA
ncbi:MAG: hypothetical protein O2910_00465 [Proteobacteria bacterium]|nr:hypothetical protein [Pseudomonadota bacterium]